MLFISKVNERDTPEHVKMSEVTQALNNFIHYTSFRLHTEAIKNYGYNSGLPNME